MEAAEKEETTNRSRGRTGHQNVYCNPEKPGIYIVSVMKGGKIFRGGRFRDLDTAITAADALRAELSLPLLPRSVVLPENEIDATHHLFRVRLRKTLFTEIQEIAKAETDRTGEHTSASDIVRVAVRDWLTGYRANLRLGAMRPPESEEG